MNKRILSGVILAAALAGAAPLTAQAADVSVGIGVRSGPMYFQYSDPAPYYYRPAPVRYYPYAPRRVVRYYEPAPVYYYEPRPVYRYYYDDRPRRHHRHRH